VIDIHKNNNYCLTYIMKLTCLMDEHSYITQRTFVYVKRKIVS